MGTRNLICVQYNGEYTPVRLKAKFRLTELPTTDEEFFRRCGTKKGD